MEAELKLFFVALSKSRGILEIEANLPLEQPKLSLLTQSDQWRTLIQKYLKNAFQRSETANRKNTVLILTQRINFELQRRGQKKFKI